MAATRGGSARWRRGRSRRDAAAGFVALGGALTCAARRPRSQGQRQVINFSGTYSTFCWDSQNADLLRMDRVACGER